MDVVVVWKLVLLETLVECPADATAHIIVVLVSLLSIKVLESV